MAGRDLPGHHRADDRWLVDRQVYERRRDGVRYVSWSRARQLRLAWLAVILLILAGGLGALSFWTWQRLGPELTVMLPAKVQARIATWTGLGQPVADSRQLRQALDEALRERDAARAKLAELVAAVEPSAVSSEQPNGPPAEPPGTASPRGRLAADPDLEMTLLRHERDAAREQIDALMQLTSQLKAELGERSAGREAVVQPVVGMGAVAKLESDLESAREATRKALTERDALQAEPAEAGTAAEALQASHDSLAGRMEQAELALAARDQMLADARRELAAAQAVAAEARDAAQAGVLADQAAMQGLRDGLDAPTRAMRALESEVAGLRARLAGLEQQLERTRVERDEAAQAHRAGREQLEAMTARLQSLAQGRPASDAGLSVAEREGLTASLAEARNAFEEARSAADRAAQQLLAANSELAVARREVEGLRQELASARSEVRLKEQALAEIPAPKDPLSLAKGVAEAPTAESPGPHVVSVATWTVVEDSDSAAGPQVELAAARARIDELVARLSASEQRAADLERYLGDRAPAPPPVAPR
ncbi:MAG TPA: hypothetical protein PKA13_10630 [Geminicoccaceae bacterium]|nr:hypothetical protein [Geminicoccus sp.]HMU50221.1 hypothetical protein [Geminicoccaceae bacterium]